MLAMYPCVLMFIIRSLFFYCNFKLAIFLMFEFSLSNEQYENFVFFFDCYLFEIQRQTDSNKPKHVLLLCSPPPTNFALRNICESPFFKQIERILRKQKTV